MDKVKLQERVDELKAQNDKDNQYVIKIDNERQNIISRMLVTNGRILELENLLKQAE